MAKYIPPIIRDNTYRFGELVLVARTWQGATRTTWFVVCQDCGDKLLVNREKPKQWVARCHHCKTEYTITPVEYYLMKPQDFRKIMGDL